LQAIHMSTSAALPELAGPDDADLLIGDVARLSGLSIDTLRYYDRAQRLGAVHSDGGGRRVYDRDTLGLLDVVLRLRRTGMPVDDTSSTWQPQWTLWPLNHQLRSLDSAAERLVGLDELPVLAEQARGNGLDVRIVHTGNNRQVSHALGQVVYRVVQERAHQHHQAGQCHQGGRSTRPRPGCVHRDRPRQRARHARTHSGNGIRDMSARAVDGIEATQRITADPHLSGVAITMLTTFDEYDLIFAAIRRRHPLTPYMYHCHDVARGRGNDGAVHRRRS
jgi:hypothetical protein